MSYFLEGDLKTAWRRRKMESNITELKDHYIICGAGETGQNAIKQFKSSNVDFVVIDKDESKIHDLIEDNIYAVHGDATQDFVLDKARIKNAKGLITSLSTDAQNVYTVLTARQMNKDLYIVSRAIDKGAAGKLKKAGANNTISPNEIGGTRMASLMLRPNVISFLDIITRAGDVVLDLEEVVIYQNSSLINKQLKEAKIPQKTGLIVLAIKKENVEKLFLNPSSSEILAEGDTMIVLGREEQVNQLKEIAKDTGEKHSFI
jgi:voltage-gated potassium channel